MAPQIHVYRAKDQPATRYVVTLNIGMTVERMTFTNPRRRLIKCHKCKRDRWAANLFVHVYYDGSYYFCRPGKGCKK